LVIPPAVAPPSAPCLCSHCFLCPHTTLISALKPLQCLPAHSFKIFE
jgi:hypothetical protein